ncbi:MAG: 4Fe-4S cluster-binding domain-containing protein [Ruminococcaceae bacterium]|nr:4Fe-4S cluster-binding domain-containing protein [Oscillospiraceae bacterium]
MKCNLCPRRCNAERYEAENINGYCKMPLQAVVARAALHFWEEPCISGTKGSGTVFFSGCTLSCIYCQNEDISQKHFGKAVSAKRLAEIFRELEALGAHNINLVTPTHYALAIKQALDIYRPNIPIVWNSSGYENVSTLKMLEGYIDIYLMDLKYVTNSRAQEYSDAPDYPQNAKKAILECYSKAGECVFDENGVMKKGVIIRHLILPQGTGEAIAVFDWVRENVPNAYFSIMSQYLPYGKAKQHRIIGRKITSREYEKVLSYIYNTGFENCYIQEKSSANEVFIPPFDLTGI